jgi:hypothetical protein
MTDRGGFGGKVRKMQEHGPELLVFADVLLLKLLVVAVREQLLLY